MTHHAKRSAGIEQPLGIALVTVYLSIFSLGCTVPINTGLGAPAKAEPPKSEEQKARQRAYELSDPKQSDRLARNAEDAARENPSEKPQLADTLTNIANTQSRVGNHAEAQKLHERALEVREEVYGPKHEKVAESLNFLGATYYQNQRYGDAEKAFHRALRIRTETLGPDDRRTGLSMNNLAFFYAALGRYDDADPLFKQSIRIITEAPDSSAAEKARALDNYHAMLLDAERLDQAKAIEEESAKFKTKRMQAEDAIRLTK